MARGYRAILELEGAGSAVQIAKNASGWSVTIA